MNGKCLDIRHTWQLPGGLFSFSLNIRNWGTRLTLSILGIERLANGGCGCCNGFLPWEEKKGILRLKGANSIIL